ncbi:MAG: threonine dehydrogenase-like Zn-dependent dehydrogenase [Arenicella sp.]|jgi:threonine dehydrogenase-like Zn-dependent dehydrogenase
MKALVYTGTQQMAYRDEPLPRPRQGDVILDVSAAAICGSDMHAYHGHDERRVPPLILGHEVCGVVQAGKYAGQRMVINPLMTCGSCHDCLIGRSNLCSQREAIGMFLPGALAEKVAIDERNLLVMPQDMDPVHASLTEPTATALHAIALVERLAYRPISEARCLVLGGGAIGLLVALVLKDKGCANIDLAETNKLRRSAILQEHCADPYDPLIEKPPHLGNYDVVFDCVGAGVTRRVSSEAVRPGGIISHIGLQNSDEGFESRRITLQEITVLGNYCYTTTDMAASINMLYQQRLGGLNWVDVRPLSKGAEAFEDLHLGNVAAAKIVLQPDHLVT